MPRAVSLATAKEKPKTSQYKVIRSLPVGRLADVGGTALTRRGIALGRRLAPWIRADVPSMRNAGDLCDRGARRSRRKRCNTLSHIVTIRTEVRDPDAIAAACRRLALAEPVHGTAKLFEGEATGLLVRLKDWLYPVVADTATGQLRYDNYAGVWGDPKHLDGFLQAYAVEKARIEARTRGHSVVEQALFDGSIKLTIHVGGAA